MAILYKTSRSIIRSLADSRMSWSRTILALRLQCLEPKEEKKQQSNLSRWSVGKLTKKRTASRLRNWPSTTPSLQIIAVSWWVDLCLNPTVLLRLAQKIISHTQQLYLCQAAGAILTFQNFQQISTGSVWEWQRTQRLPTIYIHRTSSATKWHLHFLPGFAQFAFSSHRKCSSCDSNTEAKNESCRNGCWCERCGTKAARWLQWNPPDLSTCCSISLI